MREKHLEIKVGLLVFFAIIILLTFVYLLGDFRISRKSEIYVDFPTSADLKPGAPVKISGVTLGKVKSVKFHGGKFDNVNKKRVYVRVTISIDREHLDCLHNDARFYITTLGVLGEKYIEIEPGNLNKPVIKEYQVFDGMPPLRMEILAMNVSDILSSIAGVLTENKEEIKNLLRSANDAVVNTNKIIEKNREKIDLIVDNVVSVTGDLKELSSTMKKNVGEGKEIKEIIKNFHEISEVVKNDLIPVAKGIKEIMGSAKKLVETFQKIGEKGEKSLSETDEKIQKILFDTQKITEEIRDGRGTVGAILKDREIYDELIEMVKDLKRHPWKFLWKE